MDRTWILAHHGGGGPCQGCPLGGLVCGTGFIDSLIHPFIRLADRYRVYLC